MKSGCVCLLKTMCITMALVVAYAAMAVTPTISDGLVAYYPFDGNTDDASGNGHNLSSEKSVVYMQDRNSIAGNSVALHENTLYCERSWPEIRNNWTLTCWFKTEVNTSLKNEQMSGIQGASSGVRYLHWPYLAVGNNGVNVFEHDDFFLPAVLKYEKDFGGTWHHLALIVGDTNSAFRLYIDGSLVRTGVCTGRDKVFGAGTYDGHSGRYIGFGQGSYSSRFDGGIDELHIYNRALSATEVARIYNGQSATVENTAVKWSNEIHMEDSEGEMKARNFSKDGSAVHIAANGKFFLSVVGPGKITFNARGSSDGFFYDKDEGGHATYVRNSTGFQPYSITLTGAVDTWHTIYWGTYADGYLGTHAWGELKDFTWNGQTIEFPFEYPTEETKYWQVAFDANGGLIDGGEAIRYIEVEVGMAFADVIGDLPSPERLGYDFKGWFTEKNGGTPIYDTTTATADATYYAHWEESEEGCVVDGVRWIYQDCGGLEGVEIIGIAGTIPASLVIPTELAGKKVVSIGEYSLSRSSWGGVRSTSLDGVVSLTLNEGLKQIGRGAFEGCLFRSLGIPSTLKTIESFAFADCFNLASVTMSEGICALNECCFGGCRSLCEIEMPSSITNLERAVFQGCVALTNVMFNGRKPTLISSVVYDEEWDNPFWQVPANATTISVKSGIGWKDDNGERLTTWCGRKVVFDPLPDMGDEPTEEDIAEALEGSADERLEVYITGKNAYKAYREWMDRVCGSDFAKRQDVKDSVHAWLSFALDANVLITTAPKQGDLKIDAFKPGAIDGSFDFEVSVKDIAIGDSATAANLAEIFGIEGAETLHGGYSSNAVGIDFGAPVNGRVKCSARPKGSPSSFFMRVKMK